MFEGHATMTTNKPAGCVGRLIELKLANGRQSRGHTCRKKRLSEVGRLGCRENSEVGRNVFGTLTERQAVRCKYIRQADR